MEVSQVRRGLRHRLLMLEGGGFSRGGGSSFPRSGGLFGPAFPDASGASEQPDGECSYEGGDSAEGG